MSVSRSRRDFLRMVASSGGLSMMPPSIVKALAIPANRATGSIQDVEHVVILMQENRSFDHYFGSLRGVRGFGDPRPARLPNGRPVWFQPAAAVKTKRYRGRGLHEGSEHVLPWYLNPQRTTEFQAGTDHGWSSGHLAWNDGRYDQWVNQKQDVLTMGHLKRHDVAFHYALADAFTICDSYFCSVHANTVVNRLYLWTGTCDPRNALGSKANGPGLEERETKNGYTWTTYPERLEAAKVSWRVYQGGSGIAGTPTDNYTDNSLEFFAQYQVAEGASPTSALVRNGVSTHTLAALREDVARNELPQVSWVVAPYKYCEHPEASPTDGAYYINMVLEALTSNPEVWSKTVFLINYDENDGLFDHVVPPMPPRTQAQNADGLVSEDLVGGLVDEFIDMRQYPGGPQPLVPGADPGGLQPIGLGPRVPMLILSPWTKGGWVCSQVFDHTSVLQFLEKRFGVAEPNISTWRRAVCGDLTSAFDFSAKADAAVKSFRVPKAIRSEHRPYQVPAVQRMPVQEAGTRPARALPYELLAQCRVEDSRVWVDLNNAGGVGAAFYAYNGLAVDAAPRRYALSAGRRLSDYWEVSERGYDVSLSGPNGWLVHFRGAGLHAGVEARMRYEPRAGLLVLMLTNMGEALAGLTVSSGYGGRAARRHALAAGESVEDAWPVAASNGWFDLSVGLEGEARFLRRFAGHVEDGRPSRSDPAIFVEA